MSMTLDEQMDALLGPAEVVDTDECPLFLEMSDETAAALVEGLRCALYGGKMAPLARRALLVTLDAIAAELADQSTGLLAGKPPTHSPSDSQGEGRTIAS